MNKESSPLTPHLALNHLFRWQFTASLYMSLLQLTSIVLLGQFLGYRELGIYTIFQLIFRLAVSLFEPGMFVSIIQKKSFNKIILQKEKKIQLWIVLAGVILLLFFFAIEHNYLVNNSAIVIISILLFASIGIFSHQTALLTRQLKQKEISLSQIIGSSLEFIFIITAIWFISPVLVFSFGLFIRFVVYYGLCAYYISNIQIEEDVSAPVKEHVHFSTFQVINQGLSFVQGNFDTVLVGAVFGLTVLGPYNFASEISYLLFSKINTVFNKAIFPVLSKFQDQVIERQNIISESLLSHALICISFYLVLYFNIESIIAIAFKDPEGKILLFSKFILIMAMIRSVNNIMFNQLLALGESRNLLKWNISVLIFNYVFIAIIFLSGASIETFLFINIFVSLSVFLFVLFKLRLYFKETASFDKMIFTYLTFLLLCIIMLYGIKYLGIHFILSIFLGTLCILLLSFMFYREKLLNLFHFRIM